MANTNDVGQTSAAAGVAEPTPTPLLLRRRDVERVTGLGSSSLYKLVRLGLFPRSRRVPGAPGVVAWLASEVDAWVEALPESDPRDGPAKGRGAAWNRKAASL